MLNRKSTYSIREPKSRRTKYLSALRMRPYGCEYRSKLQAQYQAGVRRLVAHKCRSDRGLQFPLLPISQLFCCSEGTFEAGVVFAEYRVTSRLRFGALCKKAL